MSWRSVPAAVGLPRRTRSMLTLMFARVWSAMTPNSVYLGLAMTLFLVAGFDIGIAFLMRAERESAPDD